MTCTHYVTEEDLTFSTKNVDLNTNSSLLNVANTSIMMLSISKEH